MSRTLFNRVGLLNWFGVICALLIAFSFQDFRQLKAAVKTDDDSTTLRVVSLSPVSDEIAWRLVERSHLIGVTAYSKSLSTGFRFEGVQGVASIGDVEKIIGLNPDVVVMHNFANVGAAGALARKGIRVEDLGPMNGFDDLLRSTIRLGEILGLESRALRLHDRWQRRWFGAKRESSVSGAFFSTYGGKIFVAGTGTSYAEVIEQAGVDNQFSDIQGSVALSREKILKRNPQLIVTQDGSKHALCAEDMLGHLDGCDARVIELPASLISSPGPEMVDAVWLLRAKMKAR